MTLITVGVDTELLLRQLRQRLRYLDGRIGTEADRQRNADDLQWTIAHTTGAIDTLENERDWLRNLINQIEQEGSTNGA